MSDKFTKEKRSEIMSKIRGKDTTIEVMVFRELRKKKIYFQKNYSKIIGKPDIALPSKKIAIFIDGDFWHGYNLDFLKRKLPRTYWKDKIVNNVKRDKEINKELKKRGWRILRVWEHEVRKNFDYTINRIINFLK